MFLLAFDRFCSFAGLDLRTCAGVPLRHTRLGSAVYFSSYEIMKTMLTAEGEVRMRCAKDPLALLEHLAHFTPAVDSLAQPTPMLSFELP